MSPREMGPEGLLPYLADARRKRRFFSWVAGIALVLAVLGLVLISVMVVNQHNSLIDGCHRAHLRDADNALLLREQGHLERADAAQARSRSDCGEAYSLLP